MGDIGTVQSLATFLKKHGDSVMDGSSKLSLNTISLCQLNRAFSLLSSEQVELDSFRVLTSNAISDVLQDLLFLHDILQKVVKLKLVTSSRTVEGEIALSRFRSLRHLELQRVPPHLVAGIGSIAGQLETLGAHRCLSDVQPLLNLSNGVTFASLTTLRLSHNLLLTFDSKDFLQAAPNLENLDLSHNQIKELDISGLESLVCVDLSFNFIANIPILHRRSSFLHLSHLSMRNNLLEDLRGLEVLTALKVLDLGHNMISEFRVLEPLANLMQLDKLNLEGNPIELHRDYLKKIAACVAKTVMVDGKFDVHSDRMVVLPMSPPSDDVLPAKAFYDDIACGSRSSVKTPKSRQPLIGDPSVMHNSLENSMLESANLRKELEERRKLGGDSWLVTAANDLKLPNAQSTPYVPRTQPTEDHASRKESHQSDDCIVVSEETSSAKVMDSIALTIEDVETQPRGALMTTSQTESAGDMIDEELGAPVLAGESDKEESPTVFDDAKAAEILDESEFLSATENRTTTEEPGLPESERTSNAGSESSSVAYRVEQDASVWTRLKELRQTELNYDSYNSMDIKSRMHLEIDIFEKDECFVAAHKVHIVFGARSFDGFVVLSTNRLLLTNLTIPSKESQGHKSVALSVPREKVAKITAQLGAQSLILEVYDGNEMKWALAYVGDTNWCSQLAQKLNLFMAANLRKSEVTQRDLLASLQLDDHPLQSYSQGYWALIDDTGALPASKQYLCVAVAVEDIVVVRETHVEPEKVKFTEVCAQSVTNLSSVSVDERNPCIANLIFTDETSNRDQVWYFETASVGSLLHFIESLKQPWEAIFDVELPLSYIPPLEDSS